MMQNSSERFKNLWIYISPLISIIIGLLLVYFIHAPSNDTKHSKEYNNLMIKDSQLIIKIQRQEISMDSLRLLINGNNKSIDSLNHLIVYQNQNIFELNKTLNLVKRDISSFKTKFNYSDSSKTTHKNFYNSIR